MAVRVIARLESGYRSTVTSRGFEVVSDEPPEYGGEDAGPTPTELLLSSVAACFAMALGYVARKEGRSLDGVTVAVTGEYDGLRFGKVRIDVHSDSAQGPELDALIEKANRYCYVSNTLRQPPVLEVARSAEPLTTRPFPPPP